MPAADPAAVEVVLSAPRRVRPIPRWRLRLVAITTQLAALIVSGLLDDVDRRGHEPRGEGAARAPAVARQDRSAAGRRSSSRRPPATSRCSPTSSSERGIHVSFADDAGVPTPRADRRAARPARRAAARSPQILAAALAGHARRAALAGARARAAPSLLLPRARDGPVGRPARAGAHRRCDAGQGALRISADRGAASAADARRRRAGRRTRRLGRRRWPGSKRIVARLASDGLATEPLGSLTALRSISASSSGERASSAAPDEQQHSEPSAARRREACR